jgi:hypothetical protein
VSPAACPSCRHDLAVGALRCRWCGSDARDAPVEARVSVALDSLLSDAQVRALALLDELHALAPAVGIWLRQDPATRGPRPDVHPDHRERVEHLLAEMDLVRARLQR